MAEPVESIALCPPMKGTELAAWVFGASFGKMVAHKMIEKEPALKEQEAGVTITMQNLMIQLFKSMSKSAKFMKELDDEDKGVMEKFYS